MFTLTNHTPRAFPFTFEVDYHEPLPPGVGTDEGFRFWFDELQRHRFRLEVRPTFPFPIQIRAQILLNGRLYRMNRRGTYRGSQYWFFDSPSQCIPGYNYTFVVTGSWLFQSETKTYPPGGRFHADVTDFGTINWFFNGQTPSVGPEDIVILDAWYTSLLFVQNLKEAPVVFDATLESVTAGRDTNPIFEFVDSQSLASLAAPANLKLGNMSQPCGGVQPLRVRYNYTQSKAANVGEDKATLALAARSPNGTMAWQVKLPVIGIIGGA